MRRIAVALYVTVALASVGLASVQPGPADGLAAVDTVAMADEIGTWAVDAWDAAASSLVEVDAVDAP
jgi:hypothetical protein